MSILIFGGTGLIGSRLALALHASGRNVAIACRGRPDPRGPLGEVGWIACDVSNGEQVLKAFDRAAPRKVVHLAAALQFACEMDPTLAVQVNLTGTSNVLRAAGAAGIDRLVFASSVAVYGDTAEDLHEDTLPAPSTSIYGCGKWFEEKVGMRQACLRGFDFVALRYCGVFGPGQVGGSGMAKVRSLIQQTRGGGSIEIDQASGNECIQLTYVDDAIAGTIAVLDALRPLNTIYNIGGPSENYMSLREFHSVITDLYPDAGRVTFTGCSRSSGRLDIRRIRDELGFSPRFSVKQGLRELVKQEDPRP